MEEMSEEMMKKLGISTPEEERAYNEKRAEEAVWRQLQENGFVDREAPLNPSVKFKDLRKNEKGMDQLDVVWLTGPLAKWAESKGISYLTGTFHDPEMTVHEAAIALVDGKVPD
ncbi:hypothetical protein [Streptomyces sp. NRRL F-4707]|uniref:hypothetical protein n=1 Tax=Streptomyces sp. NRRL F-4707 TaxID=1519496 RepID=UPI000D14B299|nr:hypothetical protein [Streptomyces sp. NRRL F-4707]